MQVITVLFEKPHASVMTVTSQSGRISSSGLAQAGSGAETMKEDVEQVELFLVVVCRKPGPERPP